MKGFLVLTAVFSVATALISAGDPAEFRGRLWQTGTDPGQSQAPRA